MTILFDEIEATVLPDSTSRSTAPDAGASEPGAQPEACELQSALVRMTARAERLRAD